MNQLTKTGQRTIVIAAISLLAGSWDISHPLLTAAVPPRLVAAKGQAITTSSGPAEIALANHLTKVSAKMYGAYWCSHCYSQKQLFGKEAWPQVNYIECAADGEKANPAACEQAKIKGYPTWQINGRQYPGTMSMFKLAKASGYKGPTNFQNAGKL
jgi:hypothetical protein